MTGTNRHWAITYLGWDTVPAIVTGDAENNTAIAVNSAEIGMYFPDGEVYFGSQGPRLRNVCKPELGEYPDEEGRRILVPRH